MTAAPLVLLICSTRGIDGSGNQPHSCALPVPVSSGQPETLPTFIAAIEPVSSFASVDGLDEPTMLPPATNSVSVVPPEVSVENPMPNCVSPFDDDQVVLVHARLLLISTRNSSPSS